MMVLRNKRTGEVCLLPNNTQEVLNAYIVPEQVYYKVDYEKAEGYIGDKGNTNELKY